MARSLDETITLDFTTHNPLTGQIQNADALPTSQVFEDITDVPILTPIVTLRIGEIGTYRLTFIASTANGFGAGQAYNVIVEAIVAGVTGRARIASFNLGLPLVARASFRG